MSSFIKTADHITVAFDDGSTNTMYASSQNYDDLLEAVKNKEWTKAKELMQPSVAIKKQLDNVIKSTRVTIEHGIVKLDGNVIHNTLTTRMVQMVTDGFDVGPMSLFLENLFDNPSYRAVEELYGFMENSDLPITEDGHFLAYKRIRKDWKDCHTGKMDNSIGAIVSMPRNRVNEDATQTCSHGLHFCSREYLKSFSGDRTVVLKINPRDVVSIPIDYNNSKGRACRYEVLRELNNVVQEKIEGAYEPPAEPQKQDAEPPEKSFLEQVDNVIAADKSTDKPVKKFTLEGQYLTTYPSVEAAAAANNTAASYIKRVLNGVRKSTAGFKWEYDTSPLAGVDEETVAEVAAEIAKEMKQPEPITQSVPAIDSQIIGGQKNRELIMVNTASNMVVGVYQSYVEAAGENEYISSKGISDLVDTPITDDMGMLWKWSDSEILTSEPTSSDLKASILDDFSADEDDWDYNDEIR